MKKNIAIMIAVTALLLAVVSVVWVCLHQHNMQVLLDAPPTLIIKGEHYVQHDVITRSVPQGYFLVGKLTEEMAYNTDLKGCLYYVNPYAKNIIYVYQKQDGSEENWTYMSWINVDSIS